MNEGSADQQVMLYFYQGSWFYLTFITGMGKGQIWWVIILILIYVSKVFKGPLATFIYTRLIISY